MMIVGECPGDREDKAGRPFVGPAGMMLDKALAEVGVDRRDVYLTNVVKHFKWERGTVGRRLHKKPNRKEIVSCLPWLEAEIRLIVPEAIVCLGSTAAQALIAPDFRFATQGGKLMRSDWAPIMLATQHPSSILRAPDDEARDEGRRVLIADLQKVVHALGDRAARVRASLL